MRHVEKKLLEATGALRVYTILIGETGPHLHAHMIPRYVPAQGNIASLPLSVPAYPPPLLPLSLPLCRAQSQYWAAQVLR